MLIGLSQNGTQSVNRLPDAVTGTERLSG